MAEWDKETARLIEWFKTAKVPPDPFQFRQGVKVANPARWRECLQIDIDSGPSGPRARTGALQSDLMQLEQIIVHGLKPPEFRSVDLEEKNDGWIAL